MISHVVFFLVIVSTLSLYGGNSQVKLLNEETFQKLLKSKSMWMVQFFSPQCGHCVQAAPEYEKAAGIAEGVINFAAIDMSQYQSLGAPYGIKGYPTFKFFGGNKQAPVDYNGQRTAQDFVQYALTQTRNVITERANGGKKGQGQGEKSGDGSKSKKGKVFELTDANFKEKVLDSEDAWFVDFYSPSCGHCKNLEPEYNKLPEIMKGKVRIAKLDATVHQKTASSYGIQGFPTLIFFPKGKKDKTQKYQGQRSAEDIASWLNTQKIGSPKVQLLQLSKSTYNSQCQKNNVCLLILVENDDQIKNLNFLKEEMQKHSDLPIKYLYTKESLGMLQSDLMIDDRSYPKIVSIYPSRNSYKTYNKQLEQGQFGKYLKEIFSSNWIRFNNKVESYLFPEGEL